MPVSQPDTTAELYAIQLSVQRIRKTMRQVKYLQTLEFTGRSSDSLVARQVPLAISSLASSPKPRRALTIQLAPDTSYRYLIYVLDALAQSEVKRYALDCYRTPYVIYALSPRFISTEDLGKHIVISQPIGDL